MTQENDGIAGSQLGLFEIVWQTFPWLRRLAFDLQARHVTWYAEVSTAPADWDDFLRLLGEVMAVEQEYTGPFAWRAAWVPALPAGAVVLLDEGIAQQIAEQGGTVAVARRGPVAANEDEAF